MMSTERKNSVDKHTNILPNIHTSIQTNKHPYKQTKKQTNQLTDRNNLAKILARLTNKQKQTRGRLGTNEYLRKRTQRIIMAEI